MNATGLLQFLHDLGFVLWLGVTLSMAFVTAGAVRSGNRGAIAFAYRTSARLYKTLGLAGMVITVAAGIGLMMALGHPFFRPFPAHWLFQMQVLGIAAFLVSVLYLVPAGDRLAEAAEASASAGEDSAAFVRYRKRVAIVSSIVGGVLLIVLLFGTVRLP